MLRRLYLLAGFDDRDVERRASTLQESYEEGGVRVVARPYPVKQGLRQSHLRGVVRDANDVIFGRDGATNFCRRLDQRCTRQPAGEGPRGKACEPRPAGPTACARARPQMVVTVCAERIEAEALEALGRATLILRLPGPALPPDDQLPAALDGFEPIVEAVLLASSNRPKSLHAALMPDRNFQRLGGHPIARDVQADPAHFEDVLRVHHDNLYRSDFRNPVKRKLWGAYMLDEDTAFQADRLHGSIQPVGQASRDDAFHLVNAHHTFGAKADPGLHFDVMNKDGGGIGYVLRDVLTGRTDGGATKHLNATPCDRLL